MAWNPARSFQAMGRALRKPPPDIFQIGEPIGGRTYFGLTLDEMSGRGSWPTGTGDEADVKARCDMLTAKGKEALDWAKLNCTDYKIQINDLPNTIKLSLSEPRDIVLFKTFWI